MSRRASKSDSGVDVVKEPPTRKDKNLDQFFVQRPRELEGLRSAVTGERRAAFLLGRTGSGKTTLLEAFIRQYPRLFAGGIIYSNSTLETPVRTLSRHHSLPLREPTLLVIDEAHLLPAHSLVELDHLLGVEQHLHTIVVSQLSLRPLSRRFRRVVLGDLSERQVRALLKKRLDSTDPRLAGQIYEMTGANIGLADFASGSLRAGILTLDQLAQGLRPFEQSGVWQSSGEPIPYDGDLAPRLIVDVTSINRELLDMVRSNPNLLYSLPTRKFEEIVAELLLRLGYKVELTPPTRDGGFDMYAAKHEILGKFLYLVECKRYAPSHRVGVEIVRSLYGVVQQKKATAGIVATTSFFTSIAKNLQRELEHQMQLADYFDLQRWLGLL